MLSKAQHLISLFRTTILAGVTALLISSTVLPLSAQNPVPATAAEAARMPQFASRLRPTGRLVSQPRQRLARQKSLGAPGQGGILYDNGPIDGFDYAYTINFGFVVSDTFTVGSNVNGMTFGAWLFPGDVLETAEVSITSEPNGGTVYFDQIVSFTASGCFNNSAFNICTETSSNFNGPALQGETYWMNLQNATVSNGDPVYWDENNGVGCTSPGCPSQAQNNDLGTIPSESFTVLGSGGSPTCYQSQGNLQIIHDFTQQEAGTNGLGGVAIDQTGNLYGTSYNGGSNNAGFAYKLARFAGWLLDPLFSFSGGNNGDQPTGVIVGPNGSVYGGAQGGIQNCGTDGSQYCGLVFNLRPKPTACASSECTWNENVPYRFSDESDGAGTINLSAFDQQGNLYGTTSSGGVDDAGTVFELTPSGRGWTKTTLYSFTGGSDGGSPSQVLVSNDGNLYGVAEGGGFGQGVVFQLTPSGGQWTERVLHEAADPRYLVQDSAGNLYGAEGIGIEADLFVLEKSSGWSFSEYFPPHTCYPQDLPYDNLHNLTIDAAGNLYGTGDGGQTFAGSSGSKNPGAPECFYNYIFKASHDSNGWHYQDLDFLLETYFGSYGSLAVDTSGKLYGTAGCGSYNAGTVWQLSP